MSAIELRNVVLNLGARTILAGAGFSIERGEFIGLLGPNGAGKTTLLRSLLGLLRPTSGTIEILGKPASSGNRMIGYMPQQRRTFAANALTGWDFLANAAGGWRWGIPFLRKIDREDMERALETVDAAHLARRPIDTLSGGERQRLLIAQAIIGQPRILLLDEPLISLDPSFQQSVVDLVKRLQVEFGMTVVFSSHELNPLIGALDRVLYVGSTKAVLGTIDEVVTAPVLSKLYGSQMDVIRIGARRFVVNGTLDAEAGLMEYHQYGAEDVLARAAGAPSIDA